MNTRATRLLSVVLALVLLLGLLDGLLRLLLFCSAIGAEFHGFRDFFAAVVTIHVPLSFIFKIYDNYNFDRAISEDLRCMPFFTLARARRNSRRIPQSATARGRIFYNGSWCTPCSALEDGEKNHSF